MMGSGSADGPPPYGLYRPTSSSSGRSQLMGMTNRRLPINNRDAADVSGARTGGAATDTGWYPFLEDMLAASAEEAQGYRAMHEKAHKHYSKISSRLMIPAIILSTLTGVANFGQPSLEEIIGSRAPLYIGVVSIIAAIFSTIAKYLRADEKSELHRTAMISWDKLHRLLSTVLAQPRCNRTDAQEFLMQYREERNRLTEQTPVIPYKIRTWFIDTYGRLYKQAPIQKPSILVLSDVTVYRSDTAKPDFTNDSSSATIPSKSVMPRPSRAGRAGDRLGHVRARFRSIINAMRGRPDGPVTLSRSLGPDSPRSTGSSSFETRPRKPASSALDTETRKQADEALARVSEFVGRKMGGAKELGGEDYDVEAATKEFDRPEVRPPFPFAYVGADKEEAAQRGGQELRHRDFGSLRLEVESQTARGIRQVLAPAAAAAAAAAASHHAPTSNRGGLVAVKPAAQRAVNPEMLRQQAAAANARAGLSSLRSSFVGGLGRAQRSLVEAASSAAADLVEEGAGAASELAVAKGIAALGGWGSEVEEGRRSSERERSSGNESSQGALQSGELSTVAEEAKVFETLAVDRETEAASEIAETLAVDREAEAAGEIVEEEGESPSQL